MTAEKLGNMMLIDDNEVDLMLEKRIISRSGLVDTILGFQYAEEALNHIQNEGLPVPDIILLDINMPRMSGLEFLEAVSRLPEQIRKPVIIMLTTSLDPTDRNRASAFDIVKGYLTKPLTLETLQSIAQQADLRITD